MKHITFLFFLVVFFPTITYSDSISSSVDKNGNIVFTNTGPTSQDIQRRNIRRSQAAQEEAEDTVEKILNRHPELTFGKSRKLSQMKSLRDKYVSQGYSTSQALLKAEKNVFRQRPRNVRQTQRAPIRHRKVQGLTVAQQNHLDEMSRRRFTAPGFKGSARKARIHTQEVANQEKIDRLRSQYLITNNGGQVPHENREHSRQSPENTLTYEDGENDARAGIPQKSYGGAYAEGYGAEEASSEVNSNINGEWDTKGRHYTPAGGGNAWRDDGTFMQKSGAGYINTKTGQFVPSN